jgi:hypothetical protein
MRYTVFEGVGFVEDVPSGVRRFGPISVDVGGAFEHAQLRSLDDVKRAMVRRVRALGGNAVVGFSYGQRSVGFWRSLVHLDDVWWYGRGEAAIVTAEDLA